MAQIQKKPTARTALSSPQGLYEKCVAEERELLSRDLQQLKRDWVSDLTFGPLMPPEPELHSIPTLASLSSSLDKESEHRLASNYRFLLSNLKAAHSRDKSRDSIWNLLAMWVKQLGLFRPDEFLPKDVFLRLTQTMRNHYRHIRPAQILYAHEVEIWLPYFESLLVEYQKHNGALKKNMLSILRKQRFDSAAVMIVSKHRKAVSAAVEWVSRRLNVDQSAISNAHSTVIGPRRRQPLDLPREK